MRKPKIQCPDERWQDEAQAWRAVAERLAQMCADRIGCCYDEEGHCTGGILCRTCWIQKAVRETEGKED